MSIFEHADTRLLPGFTRHRIEIDGRPLRVLTGGDGPPLLMLHGDPQTHLCWHLVAPELTDRFTVVLTDLPGRGESHKPPADGTGLHYSKRRMAEEQRAVMQALGFPRFALIGHDRGARVARRLALDFPETVRQLVLLDIVPALDLYERYDAEFAQDYFYFNFLTQPHPLPETLIGGDPEAFMRQILFGLATADPGYDSGALAVYLESGGSPDGVTAMCECFRAGLHIDRVHDRADREAGRRIQCPTLIGWGEHGVIGRYFDVRAVWRGWCAAPQFASFASGHFIPEEAPGALLQALDEFLNPDQ